MISPLHPLVTNLRGIWLFLYFLYLVRFLSDFSFSKFILGFFSLIHQFFYELPFFLKFVRNNAIGGPQNLSHLYLFFSSQDYQDLSMKHLSHHL